MDVTVPEETSNDNQLEAPGCRMRRPKVENYVPLIFVFAFEI